SGTGIEVDVASVTIQGNFIGTDTAGTTALPNARGIILDHGDGSTIGGLTGTPGAGAGNVISGNSQFGIYVKFATRLPLIEGNLIGTDVTGTAALGNQSWGIRFDADGGAV